MNIHNFSSFLGGSAPTPPESPLNFVDLPLDLTASASSSNFTSSPSPPGLPPSLRSFSPSPSPSPRQQRRCVPADQQDETYRVRRDKNNIAAKKSRDARRAREAETALKAQRLEQLVVILQAENEMLKREVERLTGTRMQ